MSKIKAFLKRKNIIFSGKRYGIDALGAMAQGLFASLLIGAILGFVLSKLEELLDASMSGIGDIMKSTADITGSSAKNIVRYIQCSLPNILIKTVLIITTVKTPKAYRE